MKHFFSSLLALGICLTPITIMLTPQSSWAQTQNAEIEKLTEQARQQTQQGQHLQAIETLQQILTIARQQGDRNNEALALLFLEDNYSDIGQLKEALNN